MTSTKVSNYGLFLQFIGIIAVSAAVLGGALVIGLAMAAGSFTLVNVFLLRDAVFPLLLGILAFPCGNGMRRRSRRAAVYWEWITWLSYTLVLLVTLAAIVLIPVGKEYLVASMFYMLLALSATQARRTAVRTAVDIARD